MKLHPLKAAVAPAVLSLAIAAVLAAPAAAHPHRSRFGAKAGSALTRSTVLEWYDITSKTITDAAYPQPVTGSNAWDVSWLAAARAVERGQGSDFQVAAFAQALHDTLASLVPSDQSTLDGDLAATPSVIPAGREEQAGIATGRREAAAVTAQLATDGLDTASVDTPFTPPPAGPGVWEPTPPTYGPAVRAGEENAQAFLLRTNSQFDPGSPPSLTSPTYLSSLNETDTYGSATNSVRTPAQTDVALFWEPAANIQYIQLVRGIIADTNHPLAWDTRFVAAFQVVPTDAQIAIYNAKYKYVFWRPVTAIRDGSPGVTVDLQLDAAVHDALVPRVPERPRRLRRRRPSGADRIRRTERAGADQCHEPERPRGRPMCTATGRRSPAR